MSKSWIANVVPSDFRVIVRVSLMSMWRSLRQLSPNCAAMIFALLKSFVLRADTYFGGIVQT